MPRVVASLRAHRDLGRSALFGTDGLPPADGAELGRLSLIALRGLPADQWHADAIYVLCADVPLARRIAEVAIKGRWNADAVQAYEPSTQVTSALGTSRPAAVVEWWWD